MFCPHPLTPTLIPLNILSEICNGILSKLLLCVEYRPPKTILPTEFENAFLQYAPTFKSIVIHGDFDTNNLLNNNGGKYIHNFVYCNNPHLVPYDATHFT